MWNTVAPAAISSAASLIGGSKSNKANKQAATVAFDRQKWMMRNSHQLQVEDMKKAGLNPRLSIMGGSGAHASAPASQTQHDSITPAIEAGVSSARAALERDNMKEQNALLRAQTHASAAQAKLTSEQARGQAFDNVGRSINAGWAEKFGVTNAAANSARAVGGAAKGLWNMVKPSNLLIPFRRKK